MRKIIVFGSLILFGSVVWVAGMWYGLFRTPTQVCFGERSIDGNFEITPDYSVIDGSYSYAKNGIQKFRLSRNISLVPGMYNLSARAYMDIGNKCYGGMCRSLGETGCYRYIDTDTQPEFLGYVVGGELCVPEERVIQDTFYIGDTFQSSSRVHGRLYYQDMEYWVEDLKGLSRGTYSGEVLLQKGVGYTCVGAQCLREKSCHWAGVLSGEYQQISP